MGRSRRGSRPRSECSRLESTWSSFALDAVSHAGDFVQIDVSYGTDPYEVGAGFSFDQVTVTDIDLIVADDQADTCQVANQAPIAVDDPITQVVVGIAITAIILNELAAPWLALWVAGRAEERSP